MPSPVHTLPGGRTLCLLAVWAAFAAAGTPAAARTPSLLAPTGTCAGAEDANAPPPVQIRAMRCLVSWARTHAGRAALDDSRLLERSALLRAVAIRRCRSFSHTACGQSFSSVFVRVGYLRGRASVGENLAWGAGSLGSARAAFATWLDSPAHRRTLLAAGWRDQGVNYVRAPQLFGSTQVLVWVLQFGRR